MPVEMFDDSFSDDSEFSETDVSVRRPGRRTHIRQRSVSRHRHEPRAQFLAPVQQTRMHRSASTGGGRRRERSRDQPNIMIFNEQGQRSDNHPENKQQSRRVQQRVSEKHKHRHFDEDDDEIVQVPVAPRRERAATGVSREASPFQRDHELVMGQHLLERSDVRQDMDLLKHQMEIERLERELRKRDKDRSERIVVDQRIDHRIDPHEARMREEAELYEEEMAERLRKLQRWERKHIAEEEERKAEERYQLKKYAADKRAAAEEEEVRHKLQDERLKALARMQEEKEEREKLVREEKWKKLARDKEEEEERERLIQEIRDEDLRKAQEAQKKKEKEIAMKAAAVEEWKQEQERLKKKAMDEAAAKAAAERAAVEQWKLEQERLKQKEAEMAAAKAKELHDQLRAMGYSEEEIEAIMKKKEKKEEKKEEKKIEKKEEDIKVTWIKVHRKHLLPETLIAYNLPWDWDEHDTNFIIIKKWITEDFQEELFAHTRRLRESSNRKVIAETSHSMTELRVNDKQKDKMFLVRKKSPRGRFMFA